MSAPGIWLIILGVAAGTYALRLSFIQAWQWIDVPEGLSRALRYVPPAVFSALIVPALVIQDGSLALTPENLRLVAGILAAVIAWYSRNVLLTLAVGMGGLWMLQWLFA